MNSHAAKAETVNELKDTFSKCASLILADYRGLTVAEVNGLRSEIRKTGCTYRVIKNTLARRAIEGTAMEPLADFFRGPTAIAYSFEDPVAPAKVLDQFAKDLKNLEIKAGFLEGELLKPAGVSNLAKMPGKDELRAQFLAQLMAPAQSFVRLLAAAPTNFLYLLQAQERKLGGGGE